jgi:hypothetical protein
VTATFLAGIARPTPPTVAKTIDKQQGTICSYGSDIHLEDLLLNLLK